jgi:NADH:ubiquinone oxidoreductase subunit 6 (subunit J)
VAFYVLSPQVVSASVGLRMYAMIPALAVGGWWLNYKLLTSSERRWWPWICLIGLQLALGYSHAIAIYFVAWIALAAAVQAMVDKTSSCWRRWFAVQAIAGVLLLPLMVSAIIRISMPGQSDVGGNNDPGSPLSHFGGMVSGWGLNSELGTTLGAALYAMALVLGLWNKRTRTMTGAVLVGPYAFAAIIAYFVAPMFKTPVYSAMLMPFACLVLGGGLMALKGKAGPIIAVIVLTIMVASVFPASARLLDRVSPYKPLAVELARRVLPGDVVVVAKPYLYWAVMRYAVGPNWGSAFEVLPALNENWKKLVDKLGPDLASALKLKPKTDHVVHAGVTYVIGDDATRDSATAHRVWIVERIRYPIPVRLMHGFVDQGVMAEFGDREKTQLRLFVRQ